MADVVNSIGSSPQGRPNASYTTSPCSSSSSMVSPKIVEAIDRIFPKSPSQLLQHPFSDISSKRASAEGTPPQSQPSTVSSLPCTVSMANLTTHTTTTATAVFTGLSTSSGTKSPVMSSVPISHMDLPSVPAQTKVNQISQKNGTVDLCMKKTAVPAKRISRADLEIMNNFSSDQVVRNGRSGRSSNASDKGNSDYQSIELSDSDEMSRPFVKVQREKKKKKRKYLKSSLQRKETNKEKSGSTNNDSSSVPKISQVTILQSSTSNNSSEDILREKIKIPNVTCSLESESNSDKNDSLVNIENENATTSLHTVSNSDIAIPASIASISEINNVKHRKRTKKQKLPKSRRRRYHVHKDYRLIQKVFLPCYVVFKKVDDLVTDNFNEDQTIPLKERVRLLSSLCAENKIVCTTKRKNINDILSFRNIDDSMNNSEDEFRISHGRSLRKRRQDICYAEPTEDDLLEDVTSKYSRGKSGQSKEAVKVVKDDHQYSNDNTVSKKKIKLHFLSPSFEEKLQSQEKNKKSESSSSKEIKSADSQSTLRQEDNAQSRDTDVTGKDRNAGVNVSMTSSGPSLVYVYPKTSVLTQSQTNFATKVTAVQSSTSKTSSAALREKSTDKSFAGKNNRPLTSVSFTPVSTLSLPAGVENLRVNPLSPGLSGTALAASSSLTQNFPVLATNTSLSSLSQRNSNLPTNLCMVKIDGKDYLLSMPPNNNVRGQLGSSSSTAIPFSHSNLVSVADPRSLLYQTNTGLRPAILAQGSIGLSPAFTVPHQSLAITIPNIVTSPSTIRLFSPSIISQSSAPHVGRTSLTTSVTNVTASPIQSLLSSSSILTRPVITVPKAPSATSTRTSAGNVSSNLRTVSTVITTATPGVRPVQSITLPNVPGATTVVRQCPTLTSTNPSPTVQLVAPNASVSGARCFRIIVPACSASGSTRIATLGTSAISSPLTRLTASSTLLPQRKQSAADKDMSPEKRAAKRRRLEKKYPLPPGVIIKTEPPETPSHSSSFVQTGAVRSLLSGQNIQVIAASSRSSAGGVQRFRIISPNTPGITLGSRPVRFGSNVIIRAPVVTSHSSRPQPSLLVPISAPSAVTYSTANSTISTITTASTNDSGSNSLLAANPVSGNATSAGTASVNVSMTSTSSGTISLLYSSNLLLTSSGTSSSPASSIGTSLISSSTVVSTQLSSNSLITSPPVSKGASQSTSENQRDTPTSESSTSISSLNDKSADSSGTGIVDVETLRQSVENLRKLITKQEALGLKGSRLDKLKEILCQKETALLSQLEKEIEETERNTDTSLGASVEDPVVID